MIKVGIASTRPSLETWFRSILNDSPEFILSFFSPAFDKVFFEHCFNEHDILLFHTDLQDNTLGPVEFTLKKYFRQFKKPIVILFENNESQVFEKLKYQIALIDFIHYYSFEQIDLKDQIRESLKMGEFVSSEVLSSFDTEELVVEEEEEYQFSKNFSLFNVVIIGASTGGPKVILELLKGIGRSIENFSIIIIQHIAQVFLEQLKSEMEKIVPIPVKIIQDQMLIEKGVIYLTPVQRQYVLGMDLQFIPDPNRHLYPFMPNIDVMTESVSRYFKHDVVFILLSGIGSDGAKAAKTVILNKGQVIAQDLKTTEIQSMPKTIIDNGDYDMELTPQEMVKYLVHVSKTVNK